MLIQHSALYLLSRVLPGAVNLVALAIYTHMLSPEEYGRYALVVYGVGLANTLLYWWLRLGLIRFASRFAHDQSVFLASLLRGFLLASGLSLLISAAGLIFIGDPQLRAFIAFSTVLVWASGWFDLNLELIRSRFSPVHFGALSLARAGLAVAVGGTLAWLGYSVWGVLTGTLVSVLLPGIWEGIRAWRGVKIRRIDAGLLRELTLYGLPLVGVFGLEYIISTSDRFMLSWLLDTAATGTYSAAYDLASQPLILAMSVVYLGGYPLVVKMFEAEGAQAAKRLLSNYLGAFLAISIPAVLIVAFLARGISGTLLGSRFHEDAVAIMPWVAIATLFAGLKSYYLDIAFQLSRRTSRQLLVVAVPAVLNVLLNAWWIPLWGVEGAAYATFAAYLCAAVMSWRLGRLEFAMPLWSREVASVCLAAGALTVVAIAWPDRYDQAGIVYWTGEAVLLLIAYGAVGLVMNVGGSREWIVARATALRRDAGP